MKVIIVELKCCITSSVCLSIDLDVTLPNPTLVSDYSRNNDGDMSGRISPWYCNHNKKNKQLLRMDQCFHLWTCIELFKCLLKSVDYVDYPIET